MRAKAQQARFLAIAIGAALFGACAAGPLSAQKEEQQPTNYMATFDSTPDGEEVMARRGKKLVDVMLRPKSAVVLRGAINAEVARKAAVKPKFPFVEGTILYRTSGRKGLYCDLMRNRGLGSSTACLRDNDGDGTFDEAVRFDFNSAGSDTVFITDKGKVRGGYEKAVIPLTYAVGYEAAPDAELPTGRVGVFWESPRKRKDPPNNPALLRFTLTDGSNFTGTQIFSSKMLVMGYPGAPKTVDFYGAKVTVYGFGPKGEIRYSVKAAEEPAEVGFVFRGYIVNIIAY